VTFTIYISLNIYYMCLLLTVNNALFQQVQQEQPNIRQPSGNRSPQPKDTPVNSSGSECAQRASPQTRRWKQILPRCWGWCQKGWAWLKRYVSKNKDSLILKCIIVLSVKIIIQLPLALLFAFVLGIPLPFVYILTAALTWWIPRKLLRHFQKSH
jgi:hypothetical protein